MSGTRTKLFAVVASGLLVASCTSNTEPPAPQPSDTAGEAATATEEPTEVQGVVRKVQQPGRELEVEVGPLVLEADDAYLRVVVTPLDGANVSYLSLFPNPSVGGSPVLGSAVRVMDLERNMAHEVVSFTENSDFTSGSQDDAYFVKLAAGELKSGDEVSVLTVGMGLFSGVPVVESGSPEAFELTDNARAARRTTQWTGQSLAPILEGRQAWDQSADRQTGEDKEALSLSSDVLFAVDSSDLGPDATVVLREAAAQLDGYSGGQVRIVGHTDDVRDQDYNQALSERRAASVEEALAALTDMSRFEVSVEGKGKLEPRVAGTSEEARRANRRVEVEITATSDQRIAKSAETSQDALPEPLGLVATGAEGVEVGLKSLGGRARLQLPEVTRVDGYLVAEVTATALEDGQLNAGSLLGNATVFPNGAGNVQMPYGASLLDGDEVVRLAYYEIEGVDAAFTLSDRSLVPALRRAGDTVTMTFVFPDTGQDAVTFSYEKTQFSGGEQQKFRLTDIPVVEE